MRPVISFLLLVALSVASLTFMMSGVDDPVQMREGYSNAAYYDSAGVPTICVGHVSDEQFPFRMGDVWSDEQCAAVYLWDTQEARDAIDRLVTVPLKKHEYTALTSFVFNVGIGAFANSTLLEVLNAGLYDAVPYELRRWNKITVNGEKVVSRGLVNRRESEVKEWLGDL